MKELLNKHHIFWLSDEDRQYIYIDSLEEFEFVSQRPVKQDLKNGDYIYRKIVKIDSFLTQENALTADANHFKVKRIIQNN